MRWKNRLPVKKKLKQSDEEVGMLKTCVHVYMHGEGQVAYCIYPSLQNVKVFCSLNCACSSAYVFLVGCTN